MSYEFNLPDIGEGLHEAEIIRWIVGVGDIIQADEPIVEVQTDKAMVEITSPVSGKVSRLGGEEGSSIKVGNPLIVLETNIQAPKVMEMVATYKNEERNIHRNERKRIIAPPTVRKKARELNIPIEKVTGTGKAGRISEEDLYTYLRLKNEVSSSQETLPPKTNDTKPIIQVIRNAPALPQSNHQSEAEERHPIRGLRKVISENMVKSAYTAPHVTGMDEWDVSELVKLRRKISENWENKETKLTYLPFIIKAVAKALEGHPLFNASIDQQTNEYILKKYYHIGIATATKQGLVVPVIRHANQKSIAELAIELDRLVKNAHAGTLKVEEVRGSTFTITSTGAKGGWFATPIINFPEVAILGIHSIKRKPVVVNEEIVIRDIMGMSLTFDHRLIDGEPAGQFMVTVQQYLENPEKMFIDMR